MDDNFQNDKVLQSFLASIAEDENLKNHETKRTHGTYQESTPLGVINKVVLSGKDPSGDLVNLSLFLKRAPTNLLIRKAAPITEMFKRESFIYNVLAPTFTKFVDEKGVKDRFTIMPKCYKTLDTELHETLALEDLSESGYTSYENKGPLSPEHVKLALSAYAKLHATSYAIRHQRPEIFRQLEAELPDLMINFILTTGFDQVIDRQFERALKTLNPDNQRCIEAFKRFASRKMEYLTCIPDCVNEFSAILHGDGWINNMMFKYDETDTELPISVRFIDWQASKLGSPVIDVSYFLYSSCTRLVVDHYQEYLNYYYQKLASYLRQLECDPEEVYPSSRMMDQWRLYAPVGLVFSIVMLLLRCPENVDVQSTEEGENITPQNSESMRIAATVRHIIEHFHRHRLI